MSTVVGVTCIDFFYRILVMFVNDILMSKVKFRVIDYFFKSKLIKGVEGVLVR